MAAIISAKETQKRNHRVLEMCFSISWLEINGQLKTSLKKL